MQCKEHGEFYIYRSKLGEDMCGLCIDKKILESQKMIHEQSKKINKLECNLSKKFAKKEKKKQDRENRVISTKQKIKIVTVISILGVFMCLFSSFMYFVTEHKLAKNNPDYTLTYNYSGDLVRIKSFNFNNYIVQGARSSVLTHEGIVYVYKAHDSYSYLEIQVFYVEDNNVYIQTIRVDKEEYQDVSWDINEQSINIEAKDYDMFIFYMINLFGCLIGMVICILIMSRLIDFDHDNYYHSRRKDPGTLHFHQLTFPAIICYFTILGLSCLGIFSWLI